MRRVIRQISIESVCVAVIGISAGFVANGISPRGISLSRNYFPTQTVATAAHDRASAPPDPTNLTVVARLEAAGLHTIELPEVSKLVSEDRQLAGTVALIDARHLANYRESHIPGAYLYDRYDKGADPSQLLAAAGVAERIIVYCNGGSCEDSEFAAMDLRQMGIDAAKLFVFVGGISEWKRSGGPLEAGDRASGNILTTPRE